MRTQFNNSYQGVFLCVKEETMIRFLRIAVLAALFAGLHRGSGHAVDFMTGGATGPVIVAQDTMRDIATTLHSRLDAYRKVVEYCPPAAVPVQGFALQPGYEGYQAYQPYQPQGYGAAILDYDSDRYMNRFWAGGLGSWQSATKRGDFDGWRYDGAGVMLGYDRAAGASILGLSLSYVDGKYKNKMATIHDSKIAQYAANAYITYSASSGFFASLIAGYTLSNNKLNEWIRNAPGAVSENYRTHTLYGGGRLGYDIEFSDKFNISPSVGADFFYSMSSSHNVVGTGNSLARYEAMKNNAVEIPVDVKAAYEIPMGADMSLSLLANAGYAYNLNDKAVYGHYDNDGADSILEYAPGRKPGHHSWKAGAGAKFRMNQWDIGVKYDYLGRSKYHAHRISGQVGFSF